MAIINGDSNNNSLTGTASADSLYGYAGNDTLSGAGGNDYLDGGSGDDSMVGGLGNDVYVIDSASDVVVELAGEGTDVAYVYATTINLSTSSIEIINMYGGSLNVTANSESNRINGNSGNNSIDGGAGVDTIFAGSGDDTVYGGAGTDYIYGDDGNDLLSGDSENDRLYGGNGNDTLLGGAGNDILSGGIGTDSMLGGAGNDYYYVDSSTDVVVENANEGSDRVYSEVAYTLGAEVENLELLGTANLNGIGNALDNYIAGNSGNNSLDGGAGNDRLDGGVGQDTMVGGAGNDTFYVDNALDSVVEAASQGTDTVISSISYVLGNNLEYLTLTGQANLTGTGNALNNYIIGNDGNNTIAGGAGNDVINGGAGNDSLVGGLGNDQYYIDSYGDVVVELANEGNDRVYSYVGYTLPTNVENLVLLGSDSIVAYGNSLVNNLRGNSGDNTLDGGTGADVMAGGAGNDTYYVDNVSDTVTEAAGEGTNDTIYSSVNYTLPTNVERLIISGAATTITGNSGDNYLVGNSAANTIDGGLGASNGNDTLDGGTGADSMNGGDGNDVYYVDNAGDVLVDSSGTDTVYSSISYTLGTGFENLVLTGTSNINGTGNASANAITGNSSSNTLTSGAATGTTGNDTLTGGDGDDTYIIDDSGDVIVEQDGEGTDNVQVNFSGYTLSANVENLTLMGTVAAVTGNALDNTMDGNGSNNTMSGMDGNDRINGQGGNDTIDGGNGDDIIDGGAGTDSMVGGAGNDSFYVDVATDVIAEASLGGTDTVYASVSYTISANIESLVLTGTAANGNGATGIFNEMITGNSANNVLTGDGGNDTLYGGTGNDTLSGGANDDVLDGNAGADSMDGGAGNDSFYVDDAGDVVSDSAGTDIVYSAVNYTLGSSIENLTLIGTQAIGGTGNSGNNYITGNSSGNRLAGGGGTDTLAGGNGNDTYVVGGSMAGLTLVETSTGGSDTVEASINIDLTGAAFTNIENITFTNGGRVGTGTSASNTLTSGGNSSTLNGGDGNDFLISRVGEGSGSGGSPGNDTLNGGLGDDTYTVGTYDQYNVDWLGAWSTGPAPVVTDVISDSGGNDTVIVVWTDIDDDAPTIGNGGDGIESATINIATGLGGGSIENVTFQGTDNLKSVIGNGSNNLLIGGAGANTLSGAGGNDTLSGGGGGDSMAGGTGDDTFITDGGDTISENAGEGNDTVYASITYTLPTNVEVLYLQSGAGAINATGNGSNNALYGNESNNVLTGGTGNDTMVGGAGNDTYDVDSTSDVCTENAFGGTDSVNSSVTWTLGANFENLYLKAGFAGINGTGNSLNNTLNGWDNLSRNSLAGGAGDDTYYIYYDVTTTTNSDVVTENANEGYDVVYIKASGTLATYTMDANVEQLVLQGTTTFTLVNGNSLDNGIWGSFNSGGATNLAGGAGNDYYVVGSTDTVTETAGNGYDTVYIDNVSYTSALANVEAVYAYNTTSYTTDFTTGGFTLNFGANTGGLIVWDGSGADSVTTGSGNDTIYGNGGADTLAGGTGNDTYYIASGSSQITEAAGAGTDTVYSSATYTLAANIEYLYLQDSGGAINATGSTGNDTIVGNASNNLISGGDGNDTLSGGGGTDTLNGGKGADFYYADSSSDAITELQTDLTDGLPTGNFTLYTGANTTNEDPPKAFDGTSSTKYLNTSGAGTGALIDLGYSGVVTSLGLTTANDSTWRDPTSFTLYGSNTSTTAGMVAITGVGVALSAPTARLTDYATTDLSSNLTAYRYYRLVFNTIRGGGSDSYVQISEVRLGGAWNDTDTVSSSASYTLGSLIENLILTGSSAINGTGNASANSLTGNSAANILDGQSGIDTMTGGLGDDTYVVDNASDSVVENAGEGVDTVQSSVSYTLAANVENLTLTGSSAINATGNALNNYITGNSAANVLTGGAGDDIYYVEGSDTVTELANEGTDSVLSTSSYTLAAGSYIENLQLLEFAGAINAIGNEYDNFIQGNGNNNSIVGGLGNDTLDGMAGNDTMLGGAGDDVYFVDNTSDSVTELAGEGEDTVYSQATTYTLGANVENLVLVGLNNISGTGNTQDNIITGNAGANVLSGGGGNDTFNGMQGNDTITGGTGNTNYQFARGDGTDTVSDTGGMDTFAFDSSVSHTQLWFTQSSNDLVVTVVGTTDQVTFSGWFSSSANHIETISCGDGFSIDDSSVATLVTAMAAFTQPSLGYTDMPPEYFDSLELTLFSTWQG